MKPARFFKMLVLCQFCLVCAGGKGQSFEMMPGTERIFIDAQYLKFFSEKQNWSLFSRARATAEYDEQNTDLFTGGYLNYTTKSGFGPSLVGRIATRSSGIDAGVHYFKATRKWVIFALPSINLNDELLYSWFSILRFTPPLGSNWKMYTSLELFSAFTEIGHVSSVQRIRVGVDRAGFQFGAALNLSENRFADNDLNPGVFLRKQFN